jgi:hypothetical protein
MQDDRMHAAFDRFDAENARDPNHELFEGAPASKELVYARRMSAWVERFAPNASEPLRLAARCQHIRRWEIPRQTYPMTRAGYHQWRTRLGKFHAEVAGEILREIGYDEPTIARVQSLVRKERLKQDPETQILEDVICLVFLESYFADFAKQHDEQKVIGILRKTWRKMSPRGQEFALSLPLPTEARALVEQALSGPFQEPGAAGA